MTGLNLDPCVTLSLALVKTNKKVDKIVSYVNLFYYIYTITKHNGKEKQKEQTK